MGEQCYIGGIQRFSTEDGPGIRTTVFLKGCPLACKWCHNPELMEFSYQVLWNRKKCIGCGACAGACAVGAVSTGPDGVTVDRDACTACGACVQACCSGALHSSSASMTVDEILTEAEKDLEFYRSSGGGVTLSGGEVLSHGSYAASIARRLAGEGISVAIETSGFGDFRVLRELAEHCQQVLFDIKLMDREKHRAYIGTDNDKIHQNLRELARLPGMTQRIMIRTPLVSGVNTDRAQLEALIELMGETGLRRIQMLPYHSMGISKARELGLEQEKFAPPTRQQTEEIADLFRRHGIFAEIMGE